MSKDQKPVDLSQLSSKSALESLAGRVSAKESARNLSNKDSSRESSTVHEDAVMDRLWLRMAEIYGHKWVSQYGATPLKTWAVRLGSLTKEQIGYGVNACAHSQMEWPPSLPEFCAMCQPDAASLGMPDMEAAFQECMRCSHAPDNHKFSHDAVRLAAVTVGWYVLRRCVPSEQEVRKRFASAYGAMVGKVQRGEPLTAPLEAIGSDSDRTPVELAAEQSERAIQDRISSQGLSGKTGEQARKALLESLGIKR